jgi:hypothetical protein
MRERIAGAVDPRLGRVLIDRGSPTPRGVPFWRVRPIFELNLRVAAPEAALLGGQL